MNDAPAVYAPSDVQGDRSGAERVAAAMARFARDLDRDTALHLDACVRCGHCADACHFYLATGDARYTPIWKLELFRRTYKRTRGPLAWWHRTLGTAEPGIDDLEAWQPLIYDACTMCGRCTLACPMGIDIASLVGLARRAMFDAGLVPDDLFDVAQRAEREGSPLGVTPKVLKERLEWLADEHDVTIRVDEPAADVLVTFSSIEIMKYPASLVAIARILNHAGYAWTISTHGFEATNFGMLSGAIDWQRHATMKLVDAASACKAGTLLMPECGHAYTAMRWHGANWLGRPLPFRVLHVSEFLAENVASGRIRVRRVAACATFHDPCQVSRRGGAVEAPREVLRALGIELRETEDSGALAFCCGGGGGVVANRRADALRHRAFALKMRQIDATGADMAVTSCANCRQTFDDGRDFYAWDRRMESLLELVAEHLQPASA